MIFPRLPAIEDALALQPAGHADFSCAVLRNVTVEGMEPYLRYAAMKDGLKLTLQWGDYDNILQEASGLGSAVLTPETDAVIVFLWLPAFSEILGFSYASASARQIEDELKRVREYCSATLHALRARSAVPVLWLNFEPSPWPSYGILDATPQISQRQAIANLNAFVAAELVAIGNGWLVDSAQCLERIGAREFYDWRYWHVAHAPYGRMAMRELSGEIQKHLRALVGRVRKALILDCDNTLWGGIVGEDGIDGIRIGIEYPGAAFRDFQLEVLNLHNRGVLLGLCSKNNENDVLEVLRAHPGMVLRAEHFSVIRLNWQDKATNLREIAAELNIGLDCLVFVDDSEFEINLVRAELPEVETLLLPPDKSHEYRFLLAQSGWFDTHALTDEDRSRGKMYRAEAARKSLQTRSTDLGEYLNSLEMRLTVKPVREEDLERAAQLCLRTNQFNMTTKRHTREELAEHARSPASTLLILKLSDRFGDYGSVGLCLAVNAGTEARIDTFLISCRALGRGVETAFLSICIETVAAKGAVTMRGSYIPTSKNAQVATFYERHGFSVIHARDSQVDYELNWHPGCIALPTHFLLTEVV